MSKILLLAICLVQLVFCLAVDLESVEEGPCLDQPPTSVTYDAAAFSNASMTWHHHIWNKYYIYRVAVDITGKDYADISERELAKDCQKFSARGPGKVAEIGLNSEQIYELGAGNFPDSFQWKASGNSDWDAESWVTKADADYFVIYTCFATNQRAVTVAAKTTTLPRQTKNEIIDHIESLGLSRDYFYEPDVAACNRNQNKPAADGQFNGHVYSRPPTPFYYPTIYSNK